MLMELPCERPSPAAPGPSSPAQHANMVATWSLPLLSCFYQSHNYTCTLMTVPFFSPTRLKKCMKSTMLIYFKKSLGAILLYAKQKSLKSKWCWSNIDHVVSFHVSSETPAVMQQRFLLIKLFILAPHCLPSHAWLSFLKTCRISPRTGWPRPDVKHDVTLSKRFTCVNWCC